MEEHGVLNNRSFGAVDGLEFLNEDGRSPIVRSTGNVEEKRIIGHGEGGEEMWGNESESWMGEEDLGLSLVEQRCIYMHMI